MPWAQKMLIQPTTELRGASLRSQHVKHCSDVLLGTCQKVRILNDPSRRDRKLVKWPISFGTPATMLHASPASNRATQLEIAPWNELRASEVPIGRTRN